MDRDALSVIVATRSMNADGTVCTTWTSDTVAELLEWRAPAWCGNHGVPRPGRLTETLIGYLEYLSSTRILSNRSEPVEDLIDEIDEVIHSTSSAPTGWGSTSVPTVTDSAVDPLDQTGLDPTGSTGMLIQLIPKKSSIAASPS